MTPGPQRRPGQIRSRRIAAEAAMPSGAAAAVSGHSCRDTRLCQARRLRGQPCRAAVSGAAFIHQAPPHATTPGPKATTSRGASMRRGGIHHNSPALAYRDPSHLQRGHSAQLLLDCLQTQPLPNAWFDRLRPFCVTPCCPVTLHRVAHMICRRLPIT